MTICVVLISLGGKHNKVEAGKLMEKSEEAQDYLIFAICFAMFTGLSFSLNALCMRVIISKVHFTPLQLNNDAGMI
jgi:hypothetical protein